MTTYTWPFAQSFLVFLLIVLISQTVATKLRSFLPMPLLYGVMFAGGFALGWLPADLLLSSNMVAVGTIAFHVLVIHSGTMINIPVLLHRKKELLVCMIAIVLQIGILLLVLPPLIGWELALLSPGAVIGGGATCAIGSRWISSAAPEISFYPWLIFMLQGLFSVPVVTWALRKETDRLSGELQAAGQGQAASMEKPILPVDRIPKKYKTQAYYLAMIMIVAVLNQAIQKILPINSNITALLLGILVGNLGLVDRAPLFKCDSYGLLILSLMGLMANNLASTPVSILLSLVGPALLALVLGSAVLFSCGWVFGKRLGIGSYAGVILTMNSIMGFPVNQALVEDAVARKDEAMRGHLAAKLMPLLGMSTSVVSNGISVIIICILVSFVP